jgi:ribonuclease-3
VDEKIGYEFTDEGLLDQALTHRSFINENPGAVVDNQRLEFLGDAVLGLVAAEALMAALPTASEGELTQKRASLVNEGSLADLARQIDLGSALKLGRGEEVTNGRDRPSTLADAVEAVVGAVYLDGGYRAAKAVLINWLGERIAEASNRGDREDVKGAIQRAFQERNLALPTYRLVSEEGPDHAKIFEVALISDGKVLSKGRGRSKKEAEKNAARSAMKDMRMT